MLSPFEQNIISSMSSTLMKSKQLIVCSLFQHELKLSDGTIVPSQSEEIMKLLTLKKEKSELYDMEVNKYIITDEQLEVLSVVSETADIVIASRSFISALWIKGVRDKYQNVVAYNATTDTKGLPQDQKVADINNWSY